MSNSDSTSCILHVLHSLEIGGIETWLINLLKAKDDKFQFDFLLDTPGGYYEKDAKLAGAEIYYRKPVSKTDKIRMMLPWASDTDSTLESLLASGKYKAIHCHCHEFAGNTLKTAQKYNIPIRISHSHSSNLANGKAGLGMKIRNYRFKTINRRKILEYATDIIACSDLSAEFVLGENWRNVKKYHSIYCGIPTSEFLSAKAKANRASLLKKYSLPNDAIVVGHIGRMSIPSVKNHKFLLEIFEELSKIDPRYHLFCAGDGHLRSEMLKLSAQKQLSNKVILPGICDNTPELLANLYDIFVFPSTKEGLGLVIAEAVASGIFTVCSDTIPSDIIEKFPERILPFSLKKSPADWAKIIASQIDNKIPTEAGANLVNASPFALSTSQAKISHLYNKTL